MLLRTFITPLLIFIVLPANAQTNSISYLGSTPVFKTTKDSVNFYQTQYMLEAERREHYPIVKKIDSLEQVYNELYAKTIVRFKKVHKSNSDFILSDSISEVINKAGITKISICGKDRIPKEIYNCFNVESLEFVNTSIRKLPRKTNSLKKLKHVALYHNHTKRKFKLTRNKYIQSIIIETDQEPESLPRSYKRLRNLQQLCLAENGIKSFPNGARHNKKLKHLDLQHNIITLKHDNIKRHPYLESLALNYNNIEEVPASIAYFKNLKKLNFNHNSISIVHLNIQKLQKIEQLSFYNNKLSEIPEGIYSMASLQEIDLFHNQIEKLNDGFTNWKNLTTLYLSFNRLFFLPENIHELSKLEGLYVYDNRLSSLPESIGNLINLKYLRINHNYFKSLPLSILKLENLQEFDFSHNYIQELPEGIFSLKQLKILSVVNNPFNSTSRKILNENVPILRSKNVFVHTSEEDETTSKAY